MSESFEIIDGKCHSPADILYLRGRFDARASSSLIERCTAIREAGRHLILNLNDVGFVASSGLGALLVLTEEFQEHGTSLRLTCVSDTVRDAIALLNLDAYLVLHESDDDAVKALAA